MIYLLLITDISFYVLNDALSKKAGPVSSIIKIFELQFAHFLFFVLSKLKTLLFIVCYSRDYKYHRKWYARIWCSGSGGICTWV